MAGIAHKPLAVAGALLLCWSLLAAAEPTSTSGVVGLDGAPVDPFAGPAAPARVLFFVRSDCPISNRYAPEVRRIGERFAARGVRLWLVYADEDDSAEVIGRHLEEYDYRLPALRDTRHALVATAGARVTPEAAVFGADGKLVYAGRIDDTYVDFGKRRSEPTTRDLVDAVEATLAGREVARARTRAVGCFISPAE